MSCRPHLHCNVFSFMQKGRGVGLRRGGRDRHTLSKFVIRHKGFHSPEIQSVACLLVCASTCFCLATSTNVGSWLIDHANTILRSG